MAQNGRVPFVHAAPASAKVPFAFYETVQKTNRAFQALRSPLDPNIRSREEMWEKVPRETMRRQKPYLISASYPFPCNTAPMESAADWGCRNHFGNEASCEMIGNLSSFFREYKETFGREIPLSFKDRANHLIIEYSRLNVGEFFVLGVPKNRLSRWMYDSHPYNVPTGRSIEEVVENPELAADGNIATLVVSREILDPDSGFAVVNANDPVEVERFCETSFGSSILGPPSSFEEAEEDLREKIGAKLRSLMRDFQHWRDYGEVRPFVDDFVRSSGDSPGYMI